MEDYLVTQISEYDSVQCPFEHIREAIRAAFQTYSDENGDAHIPMRVSLGELKLEREVVAKLSPAPGYTGYEIFALHLAPTDAGPYPVFDGKLSATYEGGGYCRIDIYGEYVPPLGLAGAAFDAAVGKRFGQASVRDFLALLKREVEAAALLSLKPVEKPKQR
ncbi:MAG: hypothetical protein WCE44_08645 [Candidatus Velthaea sp.]